MHSAASGLALEGNERWFLVHTQPKGETKAEMHLRAQGFQAVSSADPKNHSPCAPAQDSSGAAIPALYLPHTRSWPRPLFVSAEHGRGFLCVQLRKSAGAGSGRNCRSSRGAQKRRRSGTLPCRSDQGANCSHCLRTLCRLRGHDRAARRCGTRADFAQYDGDSRTSCASHFRATPGGIDHR